MVAITILISITTIIATLITNEIHAMLLVHLLQLICVLLEISRSRRKTRRRHNIFINMIIRCAWRNIWGRRGEGQRQVERVGFEQRPVAVWFQATTSCYRISGRVERGANPREQIHCRGICERIRYTPLGCK